MGISSVYPVLDAAQAGDTPRPVARAQDPGCIMPGKLRGLLRRELAVDGFVRGELGSARAAHGAELVWVTVSRAFEAFQEVADDDMGRVPLARDSVFEPCVGGGCVVWFRARGGYRFGARCCGRGDALLGRSWQHDCARGPRPRAVSPFMVDDAQLRGVPVPCAGVSPGGRERDGFGVQRVHRGAVVCVLHDVAPQGFDHVEGSCVDVPGVHWHLGLVHRAVACMVADCFGAVVWGGSYVWFRKVPAVAIVLVDRAVCCISYKLREYACSRQL